MPHDDGTPINPWLTLAVPPFAAGFALLEELHVLPGESPAITIAAAVILLAAVFCAVHHAEVVAARIGEPLGSLVLALSVTVIEVSLIISVMLGSPETTSEVARDTVFSAVMIVLTGIVGICLLMGGIRHHEQGFQAQGATGTLGVIATLGTLALVLPNYTLAVPGPYYSPLQLVAVGAMCFVLYGLFLFVQSFKHREYFLELDDDASPEAPHGRPAGRAALVSALLLLVSLASVVLIAEGLSSAVDAAVANAGLPPSFVGVLIAAIVLLPEGLASFRAAHANRLQRSLNLALGSALASIALTIPTVGLASILLGIPLGLGLEGEHIVLFLLALFASTLTLATGRTTVLQGGVHLVIFAAFLVISAVP